jgi:hypothetical protein
MTASLSSLFFKDSSVFFGVLTFVPAIMVYTKSIRMKSKDQFEETVALRYRTEFWKRGNEFSRAMNERLFDDINSIRKAEFAEALKMEEEGKVTSSLDGAVLLGDLIESRKKKEVEDALLAKIEAENKAAAAAAKKSSWW